MSREDVIQIILPQLSALGSPGERFFPEANLTHEEIWERIARQYIETLERFDASVLEKAWNRVRQQQTHSFWPSPGKIYQAALAVQAKDRPLSENAVKRQEARQMAEAYEKRFFASRRKVVKESRTAHWTGYLREFVSNAAWVQAQKLMNCDDISCDAKLLAAGLTGKAPASVGDILDAYLNQQHVSQAIEKGEIDVRVPRQIIEKWKNRAVFGDSGNVEWEEVVARLQQHTGQRAR